MINNIIEIVDKNRTRVVRVESFYALDLQKSKKVGIDIQNKNQMKIQAATLAPSYSSLFVQRRGTTCRLFFSRITRRVKESYLIILAVTILVVVFTKESSSQFNRSGSIRTSAMSNKELKVKEKENHRNSNNKNCAAHKGVIFYDSLGRLGNNLFQIGFANRLAKDLCWDVFYRPYWQSVVDEPRFATCFPNAIQNHDRQLVPNVAMELRREIQAEDDKFWEQLGRRNVISGDTYKAWIHKLEAKGIAEELNYLDAEHYDIPMHMTKYKRYLDSWRASNSTTRLINLHHFLIESAWFLEERPEEEPKDYWMKKFLHWLKLDEQECCQTHLPQDAVVIHLRDFASSPGEAEMDGGIFYRVYLDVLEKYGYLKEQRPIYILAQPSSRYSSIVKNIERATNATTVFGRDPYDALCILAKANAMILSMSSTFSMIGGVLAPDAVVHYPTKRLGKSRVNLRMPKWKFHLVDDPGRTILEYDVDVDQFPGSWDRGPR